MKKIYQNSKVYILSLMVCMLYGTVLSAQTAYQWAKRGGSGGSGSEKIVAMESDAAGNVYVMGEINYSLSNVDGVSGIGLNDQIALASWDCEGNLRWVKFFGGAMGSINMSIDNEGSVYVIGKITVGLGSSCFFDTDTTFAASSTYARIYMLKYNTDGEFQWIKTPQPNISESFFHTYDEFRGIDIDTDNNLYILALLYPVAYDGGLYEPTDTGVFILKYNQDGEYQSITPMEISFVGGEGAAKYALFYGLKYTRDHNNGRYYMSGTINQSTTYGDMYFGEHVLYGSNYPNFTSYLSAWEADGSHLWVHKEDNIGLPDTKPYVDSDGFVYWGESFVSGATFMGHTFNNLTGSSVIPFLIKVSQDGELLWATNASTTAATASGGVTINNNVLT